MISQASSKFSSSCNPLPQWLVNTFMSLSKKNPLRLLLPPDASEGTDSDVLCTPTGITAQDVSTSRSSAFNLLEPDRIRAPKSKYLMALPQTIHEDSDQESWPEPLPFSTPGPGSLLGSSVASNTAFSLPKHLSPVFYTNRTRLPSNRSHSDSLPSDCSTFYEPCIERFATDKFGSCWTPSTPEDRRSLFSNIYSTPGPRYCVARPVPFDSPLELDPVSSDPLQPGYEIDYDAIDFDWKPFDRKNLVIPGQFQRSIDASASYHAHSSGASDTSGYDPKLNCAIEPINTEISSILNVHTTPEPASPLLSVSPTPFRFHLSPEIDASIPVSESQVQNSIQKPSTPKRPPYFTVPGVYISPLDEYRKVYSTVKKDGSGGHHDDDTGDGVEQANSQVSNDSIESWEDKIIY